MNAKEKPDILCIRYLEISNDFLIDIFILFGSKLCGCIMDRIFMNEKILKQKQMRK